MIRADLGRVVLWGIAGAFSFGTASLAAEDIERGSRASAPARGLPDLKRADTGQQVSTIRHCGDAYRVATGDGKTHTYSEFNLRFKTDSSPSGPAPGKPVVVGTGMQGDRAAVVFSRPEEISAFIRRECP